MAGFLAILLAWAGVPQVLASSDPLLIDVLADADPEDVVVLEIEDSDGRLAESGEIELHEGTAVGNGALDENELLRFRVTGGVKLSVPIFNFGARVGVEAFGGVLEAGLEAEIMPLIALFYGGGAYAKLTPVPVGVGKRFYLITRAGRLWVKSPEGGDAPVDHFDNLGLGLGYRDSLEGPGGPASPFWYVELGAQRTQRVFGEGARCAGADPEGDCWTSKITPSVTAGMQF